MECKYRCKNDPIFYHYVEVAPYWNVNLCINDGAHRLFGVEVAPYWNVNVVVPYYDKCRTIVEVAPYWNVNN